MHIINMWKVARKTIQQLGLRPVILTGLYQLGVKSGIYRLLTPPKIGISPFHIPISTPDTIRSFSKEGWNNTPRQFLLEKYTESLHILITEAEEIISGKIRLFGNAPTDLIFNQHIPLKHWSQISVYDNEWQDIKFVWEPARFEWGYTLGRAYHYSREEKYAESFWKYTDLFLDNNPLNLGPNWISGQEIALRILAFSFALQIFQHSPHSTLERQARLLNSIKDHANRILPTMLYARGQNNNHLLSEAAGLYTAGVILSNLPVSKKWRKLGWGRFNSAILQQVQTDGAYIQHSINYHRLMLQLAVWVQMLAGKQCKIFPDAVHDRLSAASLWLNNHLDPISGSVPNLGHNDGSYLFPLSSSNYDDYRPIAQAASLAFLATPFCSCGPWDEFSQWMGLSSDQTVLANSQQKKYSSELCLVTSESWGSLRAVRFVNRPAHADQLHVDLWWKGHNVALDPGTYRYTAPKPWNNSLVSSVVHNTITINGKDQMARAGRFLWLDWAQSTRLPNLDNENRVTAEHDGYRNLEIIHRRSLSYSNPTQWEIQDFILPKVNIKNEYQAALHWLLLDGPWKINGSDIYLTYPFGSIKLNITVANIKTDVRPNGAIGIQPEMIFLPTALNPVIRLIRAGLPLKGQPLEGDEILGWYSPTYGNIIPALSLQVLHEDHLPCVFLSKWEFSANSRNIPT